MELCQVCHAKAMGVNYGVYTCASCKAFFHRSLKSRRLFRCRSKNSEGACHFVAGTKRSCQYCRFQKCLAAGMSVEAIKVGRYTVLKCNREVPCRPNCVVVSECTAAFTGDDEEATFNGISTDEASTNSGQPNAETKNNTLCNEEESSQENAPSSSNSLQLDPAVGRRIKLNIDFQWFDPITLKPGGSATESESPTGNSLTSPLNNGVSPWIPTAVNRCADPPRLSDIVNTSCEESLEERICVVDLPPSLGSILGNEEDGDGQPPFSPFQRQREDNPRKQSANMDTQEDSPRAMVPASMPNKNYKGVQSIKESDSQSQSSTPKESVHDDRWENGFTLHPAASVAAATWTNNINVKVTGRFSPLLDLNTMVDLPPNALPQLPPQAVSLSPRPDLFNYAKIAHFYADKEDALQILLKAEIEHFPDSPDLSREEIHRQQVAHLESCLQKHCTLGSLQKLPEEEYDALYELTGIDIDNRRDLMAVYFLRIGTLIRKINHFAHCVPGFSILPASEKVTLIKNCHENLRLLINYTYFNKEMLVGKSLDGSWICSHDVGPRGKQLLLLMAQLSDRLQKLNLCSEEMVIVKAIMIVHSVGEEHAHSPTAEFIYKELCQLLIHVCGRHNHPADVVFQCLHIIDEMCEFSKRLWQLLRFCRVYKHSNIKENSFYMAVLSKIVPKVERNSEIQTNCMKDEEVLHTLGISQ